MDICEVITSIRNKNKINVHGYLMIKDKNRKNRYYWPCEKRYALRCNGQATYLLTEGQYHLIHATDHNHIAEASQVKILKKINLQTNTSKVINKVLL